MVTRFASTHRTQGIIPKDIQFLLCAVNIPNIVYFRVRILSYINSLTKNSELIVHSFTSNILNVLSKMKMERVLWTTTVMGKILFLIKYNNNVVDCYFFTFSEEENVLCKVILNLFKASEWQLWWKVWYVGDLSNSIWFQN